MGKSPTNSARRPTHRPSLKDGSRIERNIFARVSADGRITAFQVKLTLPGQMHQINERFDNLDEARSYIASLRADLALEPYKERVLRSRSEALLKSRLQAVTLRSLLSDYCERGVIHRRELRTPRYMLARLQSLPIAARSVLMLSESDIHATIASLSASGMSRVTVNKYLSLLSAALKWGRHHLNYPIPNPVMELPAKQRATCTPGSRTRRLSAMEEEALRAELVDHGSLALPLFELALETGARQGELLALRRADIDFDHGVATARLTKSGRDRPLLLTDRALEVLRALKAFASTWDERPFGSLTKGNLIRVWTPIKRRASEAHVTSRRAAGEAPVPGFLRDLRWHDLRHEAISRVAEGGTLPGVFQLQVFSGHLATSMLSRYVHLNDVRQLASRLRGSTR